MKPAEEKLLNRLLTDERLTDHRWVAYIMATVRHETNHTFEPVEEAYWLSDAWRNANLRYAPWWGRGFVQITWKSNYEKMSHRLDIPALATGPDLALDWDTAYEILVIGMLEGLFTGKDLDDFINEQYCDYFRARKIVNGMDKARLIADYAEDYEKQIITPRNKAELTYDFQPEEENATKYANLELCKQQIRQIGDSGLCVEIIQETLNKWARPFNVMPIVVDGDFGIQTKSRVQRFQINKELEDDGIVGPKTWQALVRYDHG